MASACRLSELDIFHMDRLARALKSVRQRLTSTVAMANVFVPKTVQNPGDRATIVRLIKDVTMELHAVRGGIDDAMNDCMTTRLNLSVGVPLNNKKHDHVNPDGVSLMQVGVANRAGHDVSQHIPIRRRTTTPVRETGRAASRASKRRTRSRPVSRAGATMSFTSPVTTNTSAMRPATSMGLGTRHAAGRNGRRMG